MRITTKLTTSLLALALCSSAMAFQPGAHPRDQMPEPAEAAARMAQHLDLDEATQATIEAIFAESQLHAQSEQEAMRPLHEEVRAIRESDKQDTKRLRRLVHQIADMRADLELHRMATMDEITSLLTPEQADRFKKARARRHHAQGPPQGGPRGERGPRHLDETL
jgi:Spy/CpxP family protein refolding chaperone